MNVLAREGSESDQPIAMRAVAPSSGGGRHGAYHDMVIISDATDSNLGAAVVRDTVATAALTMSARKYEVGKHLNAADGHDMITAVAHADECELVKVIDAENCRSTMATGTSWMTKRWNTTETPTTMRRGRAVPHPRGRPRMNAMSWDGLDLSAAEGA